LTSPDKSAFIDAVAAQHGQRLRRFLLARVRNAADAMDLVQEVYLRLLRVSDHETIRMPEAYVFALANHVLYQHRLRQTHSTAPLESITDLAQAQTAFDNDPLVRTEMSQRIEELEQVLHGMSPKAEAVLLLHRRDGFTLEEIAGQLGISRPMVKKYLARALLTCRQRLEGQE
jgi:RNA polymerase sigma-70 factor (ECF subfamily)